MINANKIAFTYDKKKEFIKDLTFNIEKGKITTILGPNGSGKSTVLSLLCGLNKISDGEIIINDKNINNFDYVMNNIREICQYTSTFTAMTFEDIDAMITTSLNRTKTHSNETFTPIENLIKL